MRIFISARNEKHEQQYQRAGIVLAFLGTIAMAWIGMALCVLLILDCTAYAASEKLRGTNEILTQKDVYIHDSAGRRVSEAIYSRVGDTVRSNRGRILDANIRIRGELIRWFRLGVYLPGILGVGVYLSSFRRRHRFLVSERVRVDLAQSRLSSEEIVRSHFEALVPRWFIRVAVLQSALLLLLSIAGAAPRRIFEASGDVPIVALSWNALRRDVGPVTALTLMEIGAVVYVIPFLILAAGRRSLLPGMAKNYLAANGALRGAVLIHLAEMLLAGGAAFATLEIGLEALAYPSGGALVARPWGFMLMPLGIGLIAGAVLIQRRAFEAHLSRAILEYFRFD